LEKFRTTYQIVPGSCSTHQPLNYLLSKTHRPSLCAAYPHLSRVKKHTSHWHVLR